MKYRVKTTKGRTQWITELQSYVDNPKTESCRIEYAIHHDDPKPSPEILKALVNFITPPEYKLIYFCDEPQIIEVGNWLQFRRLGAKFNITICACRNWKIDDGVRIGQGVSLGWRVHIGDGAELCGSIVTGDNTKIGANAKIMAPDKLRKYLLQDIPANYDDTDDITSPYFYIAV